MTARRSPARRNRGMPVAPAKQVYDPRPQRTIDPLAPYVDRSEWQRPMSTRLWVSLWLAMLALTALGVALTLGWRP